MTIHFFPKGDKNTASSRQRAFLIASELSKDGDYKTIVNEPFTTQLSKTRWPAKLGVMRRIWSALRKAKKGDVIFVQRAVYSKWFVLLVAAHKRLFNRKLVFDFDDAIFISYPWQSELLTKLADAIIVGSHGLKEWAEKYNENVHLIPTAIDFHLYSKHHVDYAENRRPLTIGWIGHGPAHYENLELLIPVLQHPFFKDKEVRVLIVGSLGSDKLKKLFAQAPDVRVDFIESLDWSAKEIVPETINQFDIGVMPLLDTSWNAGKCAFKAIEYMACGVPVVISGVGENRFLVNDGHNGLSAVTTEEWVQKLGLLIADRELRQKLGMRGQETVRAAYSFDATVPKVREVLVHI